MLEVRKVAKAPLRSKDIPVSQEMLENTKGEIKSEITSLRLEMNSRFLEVDARFKQVDARFDKMDSKLEKIMSAVYRTNALVEEQNARNKVVLDGYDQIYRRQEEFDQRLKVLES